MQESGGKAVCNPHEPFHGQPVPSLSDLAARFRAEVLSKCGSQILDAIETLGDPGNVKHPVHYPALAGQSTEGEHFRWFVANDKEHQQGGKIAHRQSLGIVTRGLIPALRRFESTAKKKGAGKKGRVGGWKGCSGNSRSGSKQNPKKAHAEGRPKPTPTHAPPSGQQCKLGSLDSPKVGSILPVRVTGYYKNKNGIFAARLDVGGITGFLHRKEIDGGYGEELESLLPQGHEIKVRITALEAPNGSPILQCSMKGVPQS